MLGLKDIASGGVEGLVSGIGKTLDGLFTSDEERGKLANAMENLKQQPFIKSLAVLAQEASHASIFVAGARPALLWATVGGIAYEGVIRGVLMWVQNWAIILTNYTGTAPVLPSIENVFFELVSLAGVLYGARGFEKVKGVARNTLESETKE